MADTSADAPLVLTEIEDHVGHVILNRPERRNALTGPLAEQLLAAIQEVDADPDVHVLVIRGAGGAFCSGLDLKEFGADPRPSWVPAFGEMWRSVHRALFDTRKIVVTALERAAVNGGAALALAGDFIVCGEESFLQVGEVQQGMAAPMNTVWLTLRHPEAVSARLALVGDRLYGAALVELGVAYSSVPEDEVVEAASTLAARLAEHDVDGVIRIKTSLRAMGPSADDGDAWFEKALSADPLAGRSLRPIAARSD